MPGAAATLVVDRAVDTLARARDCLLAQQDESGWWKGELETNVTMEAEDLLMRRFLGVPLDDVLGPTAAWIRRQQRADGTWATFYGGPGDCRRRSKRTRPCAWPETPPTPRTCAARASSSSPPAASQGHGSSPASGWRSSVSGRGTSLPALPPELIFLPPRVPLNIYDWACWARQTIVPLTVSDGAPAAARPRIHPRRVARHRRAGRRACGGAVPWARRFARLDRVLQAYERRPSRLLRGAGRSAPRRALDRRPARGRRLVGRHAAAVGLLDDGAERAGLQH